MRPEEIESRSFEFIEEACELERFTETEKNVVKRIVHASGDVDMAKLVEISPGAVEKGIELLWDKRPVYADVRMVEAGISRALREKLNLQVAVGIEHPQAPRRAEEMGITRSAAAVQLLSNIIDGGLVLIGNAPTALFEILELTRQGIRPGLVIGIPVGFVGAAESKEALMKSGLSYISCHGNRGGSPLVAASINALMKMALETLGPGREE